MYRGKMNLPKRCRLMVLSGFTMLLYGTVFFQNQIPESEVLFVSSDLIQKKPNEITLTSEVFEKSYLNSKNELCLHLVYRYPLLKGKEDQIKEINRQILAQRDQWISSQQGLIQDAKQQDLLCSTNGNEVNYGVTFNEDDILSILFEGYLFAGGAHGMPYRMPQTFRLSTGKSISLSELTGLSEEQVKEQVNKRFQVLYKQSPDSFWDNAMELVSNLSYKDYSYYVEQDGIHVYFDPYFVAPFAAGFVEIIL